MRTSRRNPPCKRPQYWGRGGAGVLFTCSEDGTVLLLLRAEWVEQGGTWGIPGGGVGEGFYRTPMAPITDLDVFRQKAQQEAEEECGGLPPGMARVPEGLPYTQYEDCGFRYTTFILDIPKAQKDAWRPYSADGENDAFIWFPLDKVKAGRPLPDEHGDLHAIHFGVTFTMANMPARVKENPRRRNPIRFIAEYAPEQVEQSKGRVPRAVRSMLSPALQQKSVARMVASPHNFVVVLQNNTEVVWEDDTEDDKRTAPSFSDAVTLVVNISAVREIEKAAKNRDRDMRESLYTAFTYLHRFGDNFVDVFVGSEEGYSLLDPEARPDDDPVYASFYKMVDTHLAWLEQEGGVSDRDDAVPNYLHMIGLSVNSKMVREDYSGGWDQAFADLFPLCELTPPTRPLLLPVNPEAEYVSARPVAVFNTRIVPDFNKRFRAFYNKYIPTLYGSVEWL